MCEMVCERATAGEMMEKGEEKGPDDDDDYMSCRSGVFGRPETSFSRFLCYPIRCEHKHPHRQTSTVCL